MISRRRPWRPRDERRHGGVLVEFALIALVLFVFLAATLDFGRAIFSAQVVQQAADVMARELSRTPLPASSTFENALQNQNVRNQIYRDDLLVQQLPPGVDLYTYASQNNWPLVNQLLVPLMLVDQSGLAQYPGVAQSPKSASRRFQVPVLLESSGNPALVPVVEEIPDTSAPGADPFRIDSPGVLRGYVALRINYPFQAAGTVAYTYAQNGAPVSGIPIGQDNIANVVVRGPAGGAGPVGPYGGPDGLGSLVANSNGDGTTVRPFRRLISGQAVYRRELFTP